MVYPCFEKMRSLRGFQQFEVVYSEKCAFFNKILTGISRENSLGASLAVVFSILGFFIGASKNNNPTHLGLSTVSDHVFLVSKV